MRQVDIKDACYSKNNNVSLSPPFLGGLYIAIAYTNCCVQIFLIFPKYFIYVCISITLLGVEITVFKFHDCSRVFMTIGTLIFRQSSKQGQQLLWNNTMCVTPCVTCDAMCNYMYNMCNSMRNM